MNEQNTKYLFEKYPKIFAGEDKPPTDNLMCFGFELGNGWVSLIDCLCAEIQHYCKTKQYKDIKDFYYYYVNFYNSVVRSLLIKLFKKYTSYKIPHKREYYPPPVLAVQVKEKFGGLRFYIHGGDAFVHNIIRLAENMSFYICEECGTTKEVETKGPGWILTLCKTCREKRKNEN